MALKTACTYLRRLAQQNIFKKVQASTQSTYRHGVSTTSSLSGTWEPDNLRIGPEIPEYDRMILHLKGYDYPVLESYAKYVGSLCDRLNLDTKFYPLPGEVSNITTFYPNTDKVENTYKLTKYVRVYEINNMPSTKLSLLMDMMQTQIATGVEVSVREWNENDEMNRLVPDRELENVQMQLTSLKRKR